MLSLILPVYRNEESIPQLVSVLVELNHQLDGALEAVIVDDGSPDKSREILQRLLPDARVTSKLVVLSRNFGSFAAIRAGLEAGQGDRFAVMAADLQEPPELVLKFDALLRSGQCDVVVGSRSGRSDPLFSRLTARLFWGVYRMIAQREVPRGGVDVFGCNRQFRDEILALHERNSTLVGLVFWLGFRREEVLYVRRPREHGVSAWSFSRKARYLLDSSFAFSDLPIRLLSLTGLSGMTLSVVLALTVLVAKAAGSVRVPGYTATVLTVMFFGGLNALGIGLLGEYVWRAFENTKGRPNFVVASQFAYGKDDESARSER